MEVKDLILELTAGRWLDRFMVGKAVFVMKRETDLLNESLAFQSTWSGPYSLEIYKSVDFLISAGLLKLSNSEEKSGRLQKYKVSELEQYYEDFILDETAEVRACQDCNIVYTATLKGIKVVGEHISESDRIKIYQFVNRIDDISPKALARYIYLQYPESVDREHYFVHYPMK